MSTAADVVGEMPMGAGGAWRATIIRSRPGRHLINIQVMSVVLDARVAFRHDVDGLRVRAARSSRTMMIRSRTTDSTIIDLTLPTTGTYYVEVTPLTKLELPGRAAQPTDGGLRVVHVHVRDQRRPAGGRHDVRRLGAGQLRRRRGRRHDRRPLAEGHDRLRLGYGNCAQQCPLPQCLRRSQSHRR